MDATQTRRVEWAAVTIQAVARGVTARRQVLQSWRAYRECFPDDRVEHLRLLRDARRPFSCIAPDIFVAGKQNPYDIQVRPREPRAATPKAEP